jgi:hypothetical protein
MPGRFLVSFSLQITEYDRYTVLGREKVDFLIENGPQVLPQTLVLRSICPLVHGLAFARLSSDGVGFSLCCRAVCDAVKPIAQTVRFTDIPGSANKDQESSLESIFGVLAIAQDAPAYSHHHGTMSLNECREGGFILMADETVEQLAIGDQIGTRTVDDLPNVAKDGA